MVIIEDEEAASARLKKILVELDATIEILAVLESITRAIPWFRANPQPDLIFADIQLADGPSFEIFKEIKMHVPVIFITAFDKYALQAFKFNGIDYLLKPIKKDDVQESLAKFSALRKGQNRMDYGEILSAISQRTTGFQKRFIVRIGQTLRTIEIAQVAYFYTEEKIAFACLQDSKRLPLDFTLDELEEVLDPAAFFRINRQFIIHINSIENMYTYSKSRIRIVLKPATQIETIVSSERSSSFKHWLLGKN